MTSEKLQLTKFCIRSLNALGFTSTNGFCINNEQLTLQQCQNLVVWLEEMKIRLLPKQKRAGLRCTNPSDESKWLTHFFKVNVKLQQQKSIFFFDSLVFKKS
jgi:hypothetical protein